MESLAAILMNDPKDNIGVTARNEGKVVQNSLFFFPFVYQLHSTNALVINNVLCNSLEESNINMYWY